MRDLSPWKCADRRPRRRRRTDARAPPQPRDSTQPRPVGTATHNTDRSNAPDRLPRRLAGDRRHITALSPQATHPRSSTTSSSHGDNDDALAERSACSRTSRPAGVPLFPESKGLSTTASAVLTTKWSNQMRPGPAAPRPFRRPWQGVGTTHASGDPAPPGLSPVPDGRRRKPSCGLFAD